MAMNDVNKVLEALDTLAGFAREFDLHGTEKCVEIVRQALNQKSEWQPISSADKALVGSTQGYCMYPTRGYWSDTHNAWITWSEYQDAEVLLSPQPTHWLYVGVPTQPQKDNTDACRD